MGNKSGSGVSEGFPWTLEYKDGEKNDERQLELGEVTRSKDTWGAQTTQGRLDPETGVGVQKKKL